MAMVTAFILFNHCATYDKLEILLSLVFNFSGNRSTKMLYFFGAETQDAK